MHRVMPYHGQVQAVWDLEVQGKSTPYAARMAAETATKAALIHGLKSVDVMVKGPDPVKQQSVLFGRVV